MISVYGTRQKGNRTFPDCPAEYEATTERALQALINGELKFGGRVKDISSTQLTIETHLFGGSTIDTTYFHGSEEDMQSLVILAAAYEMVITEQKREVVEDVLTDMTKLPAEIQGSPLFITYLTPLLVGSGALSKAAKALLSPEVEPGCNICLSYFAAGGPSHNGSPRCKSGSPASGGNRAHCSCDTCF